jgi:hypothetical protein
MDPIVTEILRVKRGENVRPDVMRRWQQHLETVVQPKLDLLEVYEQEREQQAGKGRKRAEVSA